VEDGSQRMNGGSAGHVAVVGGGWAGCAAALTLAERGYPVALFETGHVLGGRARRIMRTGLPLDNGQHLLLGAYERTQELIARAGGDAHLRRVLHRRRLALLPFAPGQPDAVALRAGGAPGKFGLLLGLIGASGLTLRERVANLRWLRDLHRQDFRRPAHETVAHMLAPLPRRVARLLWEPLCLAALNTPAAGASARVFANVLKATFAGDPDASDLLLNVTDLSAAFPESVAAVLAERGDAVESGTTARVVQADHSGVVLEARRRALRVRAAIIAVGPHQLAGAFAPEILAAQPALAHALDALAALSYEPITTVWLGYGSTFALRAPMLRLDDAPGQWLFDRPDILARATTDPMRPALAQLVSVVISAGGAHLALPHDELAQRVAEQLRRLQPAMPDATWSQVVVERRATYACTPRRVRPDGPRASPGIYLAGDYVDPDLPATLEAAVRSGIAAAHAVDTDLAARMAASRPIIVSA
jgi:squalene-associated FAD-dependent desaturase